MLGSPGALQTLSPRRASSAATSPPRPAHCDPCESAMKWAPPGSSRTTPMVPFASCSFRIRFCKPAATCSAPQKPLWPCRMSQRPSSPNATCSLLSGNAVHLRSCLDAANAESHHEKVEVPPASTPCTNHSPAAPKLTSLTWWFLVRIFSSLAARAAGTPPSLHERVCQCAAPSVSSRSSRKSAPVRPRSSLTIGPALDP
mmetsp:Transcript_27982/g.92033  ORF Transcript_27982/g.92033 Transcript_27982/m.92033 type:complete len:200 (-) Transcript_27982:225-824(-)